MAKKIVRTTKEELMAAIEAENLGTFQDVTEVPMRTPGLVGISKTEKGNFMVYCVKEPTKKADESEQRGGTMFNTSVHPELELAYGRALERLRQMKGLSKDGTAAEEVKEEAAAEAMEGDPEKAGEVWGGMDFDSIMDSVAEKTA